MERPPAEESCGDPGLPGRRSWFIVPPIAFADLGRGAFGLAVVGFSGCGQGGGGTGGPASASSTPRPTGTASPARPSTPGTSPPTPPAGGGFAWERVNLGFVSAYLLVRGGEAAVVDTGVAGSERDIEAALAGLGLGWGSVGHVIVTHLQSDHAASAAGAGPSTGRDRLRRRRGHPVD